MTPAAGSAVYWRPNAPRPPRPDPHHPRPWHSGSEFAEGPRRPLGLWQRELWKERVNVARRAGRITCSHEKALLHLLHRLGADGALDPAHATVARDAGLNERTVRRAFQRAHEVGLLTWTRRMRRPPGAWRAEQTSNAYEILVPEGWPRPLPKPERVALRRRRAPDGQTVRGIVSPGDSPPTPPRPQPPRMTPQEQIAWSEEQDRLAAARKRDG